MINPYLHVFTLCLLQVTDADAILLNGEGCSLRDAAALKLLCGECRVSKITSSVGAVARKRTLALRGMDQLVCVCGRKGGEITKKLEMVQDLSGVVGIIKKLKT